MDIFRYSLPGKKRLLNAFKKKRLFNAVKWVTNFKRLKMPKKFQIIYAFKGVFFLENNFFQAFTKTSLYSTRNVIVELTSIDDN